MTDHQLYEARLITSMFAVICTVACAAAIFPAVERAVTLALLGLGVLAVLVVAVPLALRWLRERREDRADALTAAAWRAKHTPTTRHDVHTRAVA